MAASGKNYKTYDLVRGDKWDGPLMTFTVENQPTYDFSGTTVQAQLRSEKDGAKEGNDVTYTFSLSPDWGGVPNSGYVEVILTIEGSVTAGFPIGNLYGDVEITAPGGLGPYTPFQFVIRVKPDVTR